MRWSAVLLAGLAFAATAAGASAQPAPFDPGQLPAYHGQVQLFTLTPRGDIDGMVLTDGTEVKTPPHLSSAIALIVRPGDAVTIHGLKTAKLPLIQALSVTADRDQRTVVDTGPVPFPAAPGADTAERRTVAGKVRMMLHGPRGEINGVLLDDGTVLRMPPGDLDRFAAFLKPGETISARGNERVSAAGSVLEVTALGPTPGRLQPVD